MHTYEQLPTELRMLALSRKVDQIGRYHSTPILPPDEPQPDIDRMVAKEFAEIGVTERMVRTIRSDTGVFVAC
jgi:hypothetical protein